MDFPEVVQVMILALLIICFVTNTVLNHYEGAVIVFVSLCIVAGLTGCIKIYTDVVKFLRTPDPHALTHSAADLAKAIQEHAQEISALQDLSLEKELHLKRILAEKQGLESDITRKDRSTQLKFDDLEADYRRHLSTVKNQLEVQQEIAGEAHAETVAYQNQIGNLEAKLRLKDELLARQEEASIRSAENQKTSGPRTKTQASQTEAWEAPRAKEVSEISKQAPPTGATDAVQKTVKGMFLASKSAFQVM